MATHEQVVNVAMKQLVDNQHPMHLGYLGMPMEDILGELFHGYRASSKNGWQLTDEGFMFFGAALKSFEIKIETGNNRITPMMLVLLDKKTRLPYHLVVKNEILESLVLFDQEMALLLTMYGGDIVRALEN